MILERKTHSYIYHKNFQENKKDCMNHTQKDAESQEYIYTCFPSFSYATRTYHNELKIIGKSVVMVIANMFK